MLISPSIFGHNFRDIDIFYYKLRRSLTQVAQVDDEVQVPEIHVPEKKPVNVKEKPEEQLYGKVTALEFQEIMEAYDNTSKYKDIVCDRVLGGTFEKLLHSKHGFHSTGSTDYLIHKLGINDTNRMSFLGGFSRYDIYKGEDLNSLVRQDVKTIVDKHIVDAYDLLDRPLERENAKLLIDKALELDSINGDALGCLAWYHSLIRDYKVACDKFELSLANVPKDRQKIMKNYIDTIHNYGLSFFHKADHKRAIGCFQRVLQLDSTHESSILHLDMARKRLNSSGYSSSYDNYHRRK